MFRARVALLIVVSGAFVIFVGLFLAVPASGQSPWNVVVAPATNPLAIGNCTWVYVTVKDAKGQIPRNPAGRQLSLRQFDMSTAGVAIGYWDNPNQYVVCGCKGASVGATVTVTASYPAAALDPRERVAGVSFQSVVQFPLSKSYGMADAPACVANASVIKTTLSRPAMPLTPAPVPAPTPAAPTKTTPASTQTTPATTATTPAQTQTTPPPTQTTKAPPPLSSSAPKTPVAAPLSSTPPATTAPPSASNPPRPTDSPSQTSTSPTTSAPAETRTPPETSAPVSAPMISVPVPTAGGTLADPVPASVPTATQSKRLGNPIGKGAPDSLFATVTSTGVRLEWRPVGLYDSAEVEVFRKDGASLSTSRVKGYGSPAISLGDDESRAVYNDAVSDPSLTYTYTVVNKYPNGSRAESLPVTVTFPVAVNPTDFVATDKGEGKVALRWRSVAKVFKYRIDGTGLPNTGMLASDTAVELSKVPAGPGSWRLVSIMPLNVADYPAAAVANTIVRVMPPHPLAWLSKANGVGSEEMAKNTATLTCTSQEYPDGRPCLGRVVTWFSMAPNTLLASETGLMEAVYGNGADLGFGRRTSCSEGMQPPPALQTTVCYASSHGADPGAPGFADPVAMTSDATSHANPRTWTVIVKDATGTRFMVYKPNAGYAGTATDTQFSPQITLDSQGPKFAPHACLACHGGVYDSTTKRVQGASLQPIDPSVMSFSGGPSGRAAQEESIRMINNYVLRSGPSAAIVAYISGLYGGRVGQVGARAIDDYVPSNWAAQSGFYKQVVKPYCATCHLAAQQAYSFSSWGNFQGNAALINIAVCVTHTMPHAEIPYKAFWTKDTGALYVPGLLASTLGFPSC